MARYLVTDADLEPLNDLVCHAAGLCANSLPQEAYDALVASCKATLDALVPLEAATAALTSSRLADTQRKARAIRDARAAKHWTQDQLAIAVGLDAPAISRIEHGVKAVSAQRFDIIMAALLHGINA